VSSHRASVWTPESIREAERARVEAGTEQWVTVAIAEKTGEIAGVSVILNFQGKRTLGYVGETSVLAAHRGHGLGRAVKAARMQWIREHRPEVERILTTTDTTNTHMVAVNHALGYRDTRTVIWAETTVGELAEIVAAVPDGVEA
jgi:RimJ/RimL family protein N-acetyltransferase